MNVIFLDVDGVLNSSKYMESLKGIDIKYKELSDFHLEKLSQIYHRCDAKIVLASTWKDLDDISNKNGYDMYQYLIHSLSKYDMEIFSKTPDDNSDRPLEIFAWLKNRSDVSNFVILDDDFPIEEYDKYHLSDHLVNTKFFCENISEGGLQQHHVDKAIDILQNK